MTLLIETILIIFALCYYLFSVFFIATTLEEDIYPKKWYVIIGCSISILIIAPIATPIALGISLGLREH